MDNKRHQTSIGSELSEAQNRLSTVGMRIRQRIDRGYAYSGKNVSGMDDQVPIRDVASTIVPQFRTQVLYEQQQQPQQMHRPAMNGPAPMLVNQRTESSNLDCMQEEMLSNGKRRVFWIDFSIDFATDSETPT